MDAYSRELLRLLDDRVRDLREQIEELHGRYAETARPGLQVALDLLRHYPDSLARRISDRQQRASRDTILAKNLEELTREVLNHSNTVQRWFSAPDNARIPLALVDEVEATCRRLGLGSHSAVVAVAGPDEFEMSLRDLKTQLFRDDIDCLPDELAQRKFALMTVPVHEGASPRWWPIVLGHELGHLKLEAIKKQWDEAQRERQEQERTEERERHSNEIPPSLSRSEQPTSGPDVGPEEFSALRHLGVGQTEFPFEELRASIEAELKDPRWPGEDEPPGMDGNEVGTEARDADFNEQRSEKEIADAIANRYAIAENWAHELLCDAYMVHRFGPAAVAAMGSYLWSIGSARRWSREHPHGALRVKFMLDMLGDAITETPATKMLQPWVEGVESATSDTPSGRAPWAEVLWKVLWEYRANFAAEVSTWDKEPSPSYDVEVSAEPIELASDQMRCGLPPHRAVPGTFSDGATAPEDHVMLDQSAEDIINAAWILAVDDNGEPDVESRIERIPVDRLALKALDTLALLERWPGKWGTPEPRAPEGSDGVGGTVQDIARAVSESGADLRGTVTEAGLVARMQSDVPIWNRLVITPMLGDAVRPGGIDLRLGPRFVAFQRTGVTSFDALQQSDARSVQRVVEKSWRGDSFVLHPSEMVLAATLEYIALPRDMAAQVITRSSYGRRGLITATAVAVHPLFHGCLTLELVNLGTVPLELYPGECIAQLVFTVAAPPLPKPRLSQIFTEKYSCPTGPEFSKVSRDRELRQLATMTEY